MMYMLERFAPKEREMMGRTPVTPRIKNKKEIVKYRHYRPEVDRWVPRQGWKKDPGMSGLGEDTKVEQSVSTAQPGGVPWWQGILTPILQAGTGLIQSKLQSTLAINQARTQAGIMAASTGALSPSLYQNALASTQAAREYEAAERARMAERASGATFSNVLSPTTLAIGGLVLVGAFMLLKRK